MAVMFGLESSPKGPSTVIGPLTVCVIGPLTICKWLEVFVIDNLLSEIQEEIL